MPTVADPEAVTPLPSVTLKVSVLGPLVVSVLLKLPVPVYGCVPPVAVTVQSKAWPSTAVAGQDTATASGCGSMTTGAKALALSPFESVTVKDSSKLPLVCSDLVTLPAPV